MKKKDTILILLLLVIVLLGVLNLMWISDLDESETSVQTSKPKYKNNGNEVEIVYMTIHNNRVYPYTIEANKGDRLILSFASPEKAYFVLEEHGISENVQENNYEVTLDKEGVFPYYCLDCENKDAGYLIVN